MPQHVLSVIGDKQIIPLVVVIIADAASLAPATAYQTRFDSDIGEGSITIVLVEVAGGFLPLGEPSQARTVHDEDIEPAIIVIIVESNSTTGCFQQVLVLMFSAENGLGIQSGFSRDVDELHAEIQGLLFRPGIDLSRNALP